MCVRVCACVRAYACVRMCVRACAVTNKPCEAGRQCFNVLLVHALLTFIHHLITYYRLMSLQRAPVNASTVARISVLDVRLVIV